MAEEDRNQRAIGPATTQLSLVHSIQYIPVV